MAKITADRVLETSTTTGAGVLTLAGAITGFRAASTVCVNADTFDYYAEDVDANGTPIGGWETGLGTWGTGNTLTRTTIYASSNAGSAVVWASGTRRVALGVTATTLAAKESTSNKDATGGYAGLTLFKLNLRNAANTITSFFTTSATVARTWTLPDKDGTVAMTSDITGTNSGTNTGDQVNITGNAATATSISGGSGGTIPYQSSAGVTAMLAAGTAGQVLQSGGAAAPTWKALSYVRLNTANGYGSTNTFIRRFTNVVDNVGADITYADSATLGATFTLNTAGIYSASYSDQFDRPQHFGLSINSTQLTTSIASIAVVNILAAATASTASFATAVSATFFAAAGSVVRSHTGSDVSGTTPTLCQFTIAKVS